MIIQQPVEGETTPSCTVRLFDIAEFSGYDGPGIRTVVYFQGCAAACHWCHSPHSQPLTAPLVFNEKRCAQCGRCVSICRQQVHEITNGRHLLFRERCIQCGKCIEQCPASVKGVAGSALHLPTVRTNVETLFKQIFPYLNMNKNNGGITLSGGEALLQLEASKELLQLCRQKGIHTTIETSGLLPLESYREVSSLVDLWLFGVRVTTGAGNHTHQIEEVLKLLTAGGAEILPRIPLVPGYFDQEEVLLSIIHLLQKYSLTTVWLNPWNKDYDINYRQGGFPLRMKKPTQSEIEKAEEKIRFLFQNFKIKMYENRI